MQNATVELKHLLFIISSILKLLSSNIQLLLLISLLLSARSTKSLSATKTKLLSQIRQITITLSALKTQRTALSLDSSRLLSRLSRCNLSL